MGKKLSSLLFIFILTAGPLLAQTYNDEAKEELMSLKPGTTTFLARGYSHAGFEVIDDDVSFVSGAFAPIFLWKQGDRILFESELEVEFEDEDVQFSLEYANISYILNDYFIIRAGNFLTPFGIFNERLHPAWINKFPNAPLGMGHDPVGPTREFGAELRGAAPLGNSKINYSLYVSNGPVLEIHDEDPEEPPTTSLAGLNFEDNNNSKAIGGRLGFLPFGNSILELGFSGQYNSGIGDKDTRFDDISYFGYATDLSLVKNSISSLKGNIDFKAQWNHVDVEKFNVELPDGDLQEIDQNQDAYFAQLAYRPALSQSDFVSKLEFVGRFSGIDLTEPVEHEEEGGTGDPGERQEEVEEGHAEGDQTRWSVGVNYWITWRSVVKVSYQITDNEESVPGFFIHYALGF